MLDVSGLMGQYEVDRAVSGLLGEVSVHLQLKHSPVIEPSNGDTLQFRKNLYLDSYLGWGTHIKDGLL
jgi:hypothetical protein